MKLSFKEFVNLEELLAKINELPYLPHLLAKDFNLSDEEIKRFYWLGKKLSLKFIKKEKREEEIYNKTQIFPKYIDVKLTISDYAILETLLTYFLIILENLALNNITKDNKEILLTEKLYNKIKSYRIEHWSCTSFCSNCIIKEIYRNDGNNNYEFEWREII